MTTETSNGEILEAISLLADNVQVIQELAENTHAEVAAIKATMVTKNYLDDKLNDLKGDTVSMVRKEDQKINRLVGVLAEKRVLSEPETKDVLSFKVFP